MSADAAAAVTSSWAAVGTFDEASVFDAEFAFTRDDFQLIAGLLYARAGIALPENKAALVYSRLSKRLRQLGLTTFTDYCALLDGGVDSAEVQVMLRALTTNVTRFFREPHHFDDLRRLVAQAAPAVRAGARLRLWSAGCSTGQEPYTMAFTVLSVIPEANQLDVRILASDIDTDVLATAEAGVYSAEQIEDMPAHERAAWFEPDRAGAWRVSPAPRELIAFRELNLNGRNWPMRGPFNAVFCRNVAIYFDEPTQDQLWARFAPLMARDSRLYVGHSERVRDPAFAACGLTAYRRVGDPA